MAKIGLIIGIVVVVVLLLGIGAYLLMQNSASAPISNGNNGGNTGSGNGNSGGNTGGSGGGSGGATYSVSISGFEFSPSTKTIKVGDAITWTNMDSVRHTVTSDSGSELDSPLFGQGQSYSHTFNTVGTYTYHCTPHPNMKGTIIVE